MPVVFAKRINSAVHSRTWPYATGAGIEHGGVQRLHTVDHHQPMVGARRCA
jgi:hypothetical protein